MDAKQPGPRAQARFLPGNIEFHGAIHRLDRLAGGIADPDENSALRLAPDHKVGNVVAGVGEAVGKPFLQMVELVLPLEVVTLARAAGAFEYPHPLGDDIRKPLIRGRNEMQGPAALALCMEIFQQILVEEQHIGIKCAGLDHRFLEFRFSLPKLEKRLRGPPWQAAENRQELLDKAIGPDQRPIEIDRKWKLRPISCLGSGSIHEAFSDLKCHEAARTNTMCESVTNPNRRAADLAPGSHSSTAQMTIVGRRKMITRKLRLPDYFDGFRHDLQGRFRGNRTDEPCDTLCVACGKPKPQETRPSIEFMQRSLTHMAITVSSDFCRPAQACSVPTFAGFDREMRRSGCKPIVCR